MFSLGHPVEGSPGQRINELDLGITQLEPPDRSGSDGYFHRQRNGLAGGGFDSPKLAHRLLHAQPAAASPEAVVTIEPAGDGVAAEGQYTAAIAVYFGDQGVINEV